MIKKEKDPIRLMQWADDHFPPIDLSNELKGILQLIGEVRRLRKLNATLMICNTLDVHNAEKIKKLKKQLKK